MSAKILVVDDSLMIRRMVGKALDDAGFAVIEAADGLEALERLAEHPDTRLVVCDINMPRLSGIEFLERLRSDPAIRDIAVVVLTTEGQPELIQRAKDLGVKGWMLKPFKANLLVITANKLTARAA